MSTAKALVKVLVAVLMASAVTMAFFGAPTSLACRIQPAPTLTFLAVLLATPLAGRLFCECCCPLGLFQSLVNLLFHPKTKVRRVCTRLPESPAQRIVRWTVFLLSAALIAGGFGAIGWMLTPYALYGKALARFVPGLALFAAVAGTAALGKGRFWCNWICPAGTLFALLSKKSLCAHAIGKRCANCKACFGQAAPAKAKGAAEGVSRRDALKGLAFFAAIEAVDKTTDGGFAPVSLPGVPDRPAAALPPGALDRRLFNLKCVACGLCIANCRGGCLSASTALKRFGQPEMDFRRGYCLAACARPCATVCPAGAIRPLEGVPRKDIRTGHAIWKRDRCLRETEGVECTACSRKCPVGAIHLVEGFPVVDKGACIGCGACEHVCPARPTPAIFVKGFERQRVVRPFGEAALLEEMKALAEGGASCVAAREGVIVGQERGEGLLPLAKLFSEGKLEHSLVVEKVVGRAAAAFCIAGKAKRVHALLASAEAVALLEAKGVGCTAEKTVPRILNRDQTARCPMEEAIEGLEDPAKMVAALKARLGL